jgi:hypothetical protein
MLKPSSLTMVAKLLGTSAYIALGDVIYRCQGGSEPVNQQVAKMREEFSHYHYEGILQDWSSEQVIYPVDLAPTEKVLLNT